MEERKKKLMSRCPFCGARTLFNQPFGRIYACTTWVFRRNGIYERGCE